MVFQHLAGKILPHEVIFEQLLEERRNYPGGNLEDVCFRQT